MTIMTVVGARPQFIKAAVMSRALRPHHREILVHTGQHYDPNMSEIFFKELGIPKPDYNLGISGGSHAKMTGQMMEALESLMIELKPDLLLVYGDTNSTLAAALAASKLMIPIAHVEAGNREEGTMDNPEVINRIVTDHLSSLNFACTQSALDSLIKEDLGARSFLVGDPMLDAFMHTQKTTEKPKLLDLKGREAQIPEAFYYMTYHRQENTDDISKLEAVLQAMNRLDAMTLYPVHPRTRKAVEALNAKEAYSKILFLEPVGYLASVWLVSHAKRIVTDSGGVQREAFFAGKPCLTLLDFVTWPETMGGDCNQLCKPQTDMILEKIKRPITRDPLYQPFGDGRSCEKMREIIDQFARRKQA